MKHLYTAFLALLIVGSAGLAAKPALAGGYRYNAECNCNVPISSRRVVREAPRVNVHTRVVNTRKVIPRYRNIEENQLVVHVRPVINREVVVHRQHIHYQNIVTKRINTLIRFREEVVNGGVSNRYQTTTSSSTVVRVVPGRNCNCGGEERVAVGPRDVSYRY
jgi:hypothetical protein